MRIVKTPTRRSVFGMLAAPVVIPVLIPVLTLTKPVHAQQTPPVIKVWKDPGCGCCGGWVEHLQANGFQTIVTETNDVRTVKTRLRVPSELASCHTAEIAGYVIEGHVPAPAIERLLAEKPAAIGLAVPGMPIGSPGMEGGAPETYDVIIFTASTQQTYGRYIGSRQV